MRNSHLVSNVATLFLARSTLLLTISLTALAAADGTGLLGSYYSGARFSGAVTQRLDSTIGFDWGGTAPVATVGADKFCVKWTGRIRAPSSETITFTTTSDDGIILLINGQVVIDHWSDHSPTDLSGTFTMIAGSTYDIQLRYYENTGGAVAKLYWSSPTRVKELVPTRYLYPDLAASATPLGIAAPETSYTNPAWFEGCVYANASSIEVMVDTRKVTVVRPSLVTWFANEAAGAAPLGITLKQSGTTSVKVTAIRNGVAESQTQIKQWKPLNLASLPYGMDSLMVRKGDQALITSSLAGTKLEIDLNYNGTTFTPDWTGSPNGLYKATFATAGIFDVRARVDGVMSGKLLVNAVGVDFGGTTACQLDYRRTKDIAISPPGAVDRLAFGVSDPDKAEVAFSKALTGGAQVTICPFASGSISHWVRIGDEFGPMVAQQEVDEFDLHTTASKYIVLLKTYPDGSRLAEGTLVMTPLVRDLDVTLSAWIAGVTFEDSTTVKKVTTNAFSPTSTGGTYVYRILTGPSVTLKFCHSFAVTQRGVRISP
jgi:PA14 domain